MFGEAFDSTVRTAVARSVTARFAVVRSAAVRSAVVRSSAVCLPWPGLLRFVSGQFIQKLHSKIYSDCTDCFNL